VPGIVAAVLNTETWLSYCPRTGPYPRIHSSQPKAVSQRSLALREIRKVILDADNCELSFQILEALPMLGALMWLQT